MQEFEDNVSCFIEGIVFLERAAGYLEHSAAIALRLARQRAAWDAMLAGVAGARRVREAFGDFAFRAMVGIAGKWFTLPLFDAAGGRIFCTHLIALAGADPVQWRAFPRPGVLGEAAVLNALDNGTYLRVYRTPAAWIRDGNSSLQYYADDRWRRGAVLIDPEHWLVREAFTYAKGFICDDDAHARQIATMRNQIWRTLRPKHKPEVKVVA